MKNRKKVLLAPLVCFLFLAFTIIASCRKENIPPPRNEILLEANTTEENYVSNPGFSESDSSSNFFKNWDPDFPHNYMVGVDTLEGGIGWERNAAGSFYISQKISLEPERFYKVSVDCDYAIRDYFAGGLYIMDQHMQTILGKAERRFNTGSETLEFVFKIDEKDTIVNMIMGFIDGMNGSIQFKNPKIVAFNFAPRLQNSKFSNYLIKKLNLSFDERYFNRSVLSVANFVNETLLSEYSGNRLADAKMITEMLNPDLYPYFIKNLNEMDSIYVAYCQRASLSFGEILSNEFRIPVRQVHNEAGGTGVHQFVDYWNPYLNRWIAIDLYFSSVFKKQSLLLSSNEIEPIEAISLMKKFGNNSFSTDLEEAAGIWDACDEVVVDQNYYLSYPFGNTVRWVSHGIRRIKPSE